ATRKLVSVAEVAHKAGRKVGIISSVTINHATPAAFYAHRAKRSEYYNIGLDLIHSDFEFFGGGGFGGIVDDKSSAEYQGDLYALAEKKGYRVVEGRDALNALTKKDKKVLARGCFGALPYTIDANKEVPTLEEFTVKAIELLDNPNGFFMMIEGGSVDWAGHGNDAATNITEVIALDKTVKRAFDFAKKHPDETLIVVTGDHETGGMTMGFSGTGYALYVERLAHQKASIGQFNLKLIQEQMKNMDMTFEDAKKLLHQYFGFEYTGTSPMLLTKSELELLKQAFEKRKLAETARMIINNKAGIGWTSHAHTALPVLTTSYGQKSELFTGFFDNTDISKKLKSLLK
ncbi:MAG: alkaline phosphatase, partial [Lentisphaeria bacterium]